MAAEYPGAVPTFTTKTNKVDLVDAAHVNTMQDEIVALATELGTDVAGSVTDLKTRIYVCIDNDGAVRKGTSYPGTTVAGQLFFRTDEDEMYYRNAANDAWTALSVADAAISQVKLKTSMGSVSQAGSTYANNTLPGGEYGFYPQTKMSNYHNATYGAQLIKSDDAAMTWTSYATVIALRGTGSYSMYAQQRYVTASGRDHWIFLLIDKITKKQKGGYQALDHPSYGNGATEDEMPHPFLSFNPDTDEIILIDNEILHELKPKITKNRCILTLITEEYEVDYASNPIYEEREIIKIDEFGDMPGEIIKTMKTPDWAKIKIIKDEITLKRRMVKTLPANILFKKLKKKGE